MEGHGRLVFSLLFCAAVAHCGHAGKYVGSRPITIKKATTAVAAVNIGAKKALKLEKEAKERATAGGPKRSQRGGGVLPGHGTGSFDLLGDVICYSLAHQVKRHTSDVNRYIAKSFRHRCAVLCQDSNMLEALRRGDFEKCVRRLRSAAVSYTHPYLSYFIEHLIQSIIAPTRLPFFESSAFVLFSNARRLQCFGTPFV